MKPFWLAPLCSLVLGCGSPPSSAAPAAATAPSLTPAPSVSPSPPAAEPALARAQALVAAADRSEDDRALDAGRKPAELLSFFGIAPGMKVAEISAGGGYTTE